MEHKVTIIIPAYNVSKYIENTVESCIKQTYKNIEIIIINDGSNDNTLDIIQKYEKYYSYIKVVTTKNQGLSATRNKGLEMASGEYIIFLDGDDWIEDTLVSQCVEKMQGELDVLFFNAVYCIESNNRIVDKKEEQRYELADKVCNGYEVFHFGSNHTIRHEAWRGCYSKKFLDDYGIRFIPDIIYEDNSFWFDVMFRAKKIMYINVFGYNYRKRRNSITNSPASFKHIESVLFLIKYILIQIKKFYFDSSCLILGANKIVDIMKECEKKIATESLLDLEVHKAEILKKKEEIFEITTLLFELEDCEALKKSKYYLWSHLCFFVGIYSEKMINETKLLRENTIILLKNKFLTWPLQNKEMVGLFGSGRNADVILETYREILGQIKSKYIYIDSNKESLMYKHLNKDIINISDIENYDINKIIICSIYYEKDMLDGLNKIGYSGKIYRVYDEDVVNLDGILVGNFYELYLKFVKSEQKKRILLIGTPEYSNIGDHLIALAEHEYLKKYFPEYTIIEISNMEYCLHKTKLKKLIKNDDLLMVTGGGFLGSLWTEGLFDEVLDLIDGYPDNEIVIMPQSLYFDNDELGAEYMLKMQKAFLKNKRIKICLREKFSYSRMIDLVGVSSRIRLFPDIALFYNIDSSDIVEKSSVGIFLRNDKESILTTEQKFNIENAAQKFGDVNHFSMQYHAQILLEDRMNAVIEKINEIGKFKFVVTDALHCVVICAIINVPCVAINNISSKVEGVYRWIENKKNVVFYNNDGQQFIEECIEKVLNGGQMEKNMSFLDEYWESLNTFIRERL